MRPNGGDPTESAKGGCFRALLAAPLLVVLAPVAAVIRAWRTRRRGSEILVETRLTERALEGRGVVRVSASIDVPAPHSGARIVTERVVRIVEALGTAGTVVHLVHREPSREETIAVPVGISINDVAERLHLSLRRSVLDGRRLVWLALPQGRRLGEWIDPTAYDPDDPGEPEVTLAGIPCPWAFMVTRNRLPASVRYDLQWFVDRDHGSTVEGILRSLGSPGP